MSPRDFKDILINDDQLKDISDTVRELTRSKDFTIEDGWYTFQIHAEFEELQEDLMKQAVRDYFLSLDWSQVSFYIPDFHQNYELSLKM